MQILKQHSVKGLTTMQGLQIMLGPCIRLANTLLCMSAWTGTRCKLGMAILHKVYTVSL